MPLILLALALAACEHKPPRPDLNPPLPAVIQVPVATQAPTEPTLLAKDDPILKGIDVPRKKWPLVANAGPARKYSPEDGIVSYVKKPQRAAEKGYFDIEEMVAAHKELPLGSIVRCTRTDNGKSVIVLIKDRGPNIDGRILDLSRAAAAKIGLQRKGITHARVEVLAYPRDSE